MFKLVYLRKHFDQRTWQSNGIYDIPNTAKLEILNESTDHGWYIEIKLTDRLFLSSQVDHSALPEERSPQFKINIFF